MKKLLAMLLALMVFQLPMASLAEDFDDLGETIGGADQETEIVVTDEANKPAGQRMNTILSIKELRGMQVGEASIDAAINDLVNALALVFYQQGDEGGMALQLSGQDVVTLGGAVSGDDFYLNSNLLGGTVVVSPQEIEPLIGRFLDMFVAMEAISAQDAQEIKEVMAEAFDEMEASMSSSMESMMALQELENINFSALEKLLPLVMENIEFVEAPVVPKMCDAADSGISVSISNDEFVEILRACLDFVDDNPVLKEYMGATGEFYTEEEIQERWNYYKDSKLYKSEEEFRSRYMTVDAALKEARESLDGAKLLDGDFTFAFYVDEAGVPVYGVMNLPMHDGYTTEVLEIVYTRQTVAAGVAYVCNFTVDGETFTIDALSNDASTVINFIATNGMKTMDIIITNVGEDALKAELNGYEGNRNKETNDKVFSALLEGEWEMTNARCCLTGKLTMTNYDRYAGEESVVFAVNADYTNDGENMIGATDLSFDAEGVGLTLRVASVAAEAQESIMAGEVIRPAELDDEAFQTWFVGLVNGVTTVLGNALTALPESVLMLVISSGML